MIANDEPLVWLLGEVKTPPFSSAARIAAGFLLRSLQKGENLSMPHSRSMPSIGSRCHKLRINAAPSTWRLIYRIDEDAIIILEVFSKKTQQTSKKVIAVCKKKIKEYDNAARESQKISK